MENLKMKVDSKKLLKAIRYCDKVDENHFSVFRDIGGNFVYQPEFKDKRFFKYVSEVEKILYDFIAFYFTPGPCNNLDYIISNQLMHYYEYFYRMKTGKFFEKGESDEETGVSISDGQGGYSLSLAHGYSSDDMLSDIMNTEGALKFVKKDGYQISFAIQEPYGNLVSLLCHDRKTGIVIETPEQLEKVFKYIFILTKEKIYELFGKDIITFDEVLKHNIETACMNYIRDQYLQGNLTKGDYQEYLPETLFEKFKILEDIINDTVEDINNIVLYNYELQKDVIDKKANEQQEKIKAENTKLKTKIEELQQTIKEQKEELSERKTQVTRLESENKKLNDKIEKINNNTEVKNLQSKNKELIHEKEKIKKDYQHLKDKYDRLKKSEKNNIKEELIDIQPEQREEIDCTLNYLFVVDTTKSTCVNALKETFPNAVFHDTYSSLYNMNIDMVICLTGLINHSLYRHFKRQCQSQNIAFIHCSFQNPEMVKDEIYRFFT